MNAACASPDFSAQTAEARTPLDQHQWLRARSAEFKAEGATWLRAAVHPSDPWLTLLEGWRVRPEPEPEPAFHMVPA